MTQAATTGQRDTALQRIAGGLTRWSTRWVPDAWVIAILLTLIVFVMGFLLTPGGYTFGKVSMLVEGWGTGFWDLLTFAMQMALIMLAGYVVATSPPFRRVLAWIAGIPRGPKSAVAVMALTSMVLVLFNWGLGLIGAALLVRAMAPLQPRVDYRLLVAAAYLGMAGTWHAGLSASAPLLVATPGNFAEEFFGLIPVSQTIFSAFNLVLVLLVLLLWVVLTPLLHPRDENVVGPPPQLAAEDAAAADALRQIPDPAERSPAQRIEHSPVINLTIGIAGIAYLVLYLGGLEGGILAGITLDTVNFLFLFLGIILHGTPASLLAAAQQGGTFIWGVILQFPFYAGMLGIITASGLSEVMADWFTSVANAQTYPAIVYWYSGILNYFVPSGGSKFAIEAPYIAQAAQNLGVPLDLTLLAYAWGDMATDAIQPFWAIPLLGIAGLGFRDIMGFLLVLFIPYALLVTGAFLLAPLLW